MAGQRETVPLSPLPCLHRQEEFREVNGSQNDDYSEPPHPEVSRVDDDIFCPPSPAPSSPGEEPGRQEDDVSDSSPDLSEDSSEESEDLLDGLDLPRLRAVQPCTTGPLCCDEYLSTLTQEEWRQLERWEDHCQDQLMAGEELRPDLEREEDGIYPLSLTCSMLKTIRNK